MEYQFICPNCHRAKTITVTKNLNGEQIYTNTRIKKEPKQKFCISCNKEISWEGTHCRSCSRMGKSKILWPDDETLKQMVWDKPSSAVAKELGIYDKAVEKRCKRQGIEKPLRGYWQKLKANKLT